MRRFKLKCSGSTTLRCSTTLRFSLNLVPSLFTLQALPDSAESLCLSEMGGTEGRDGEAGVQGQFYLNIGLHNGVLLRTVVDQVTGDLSDTRTR